VADGKLYLRDDKDVICVALPKGRPAVHPSAAVGKSSTVHAPHPRVISARGGKAGSTSRDRA
jgi:hypothetical protein